MADARRVLARFLSAMEHDTPAAFKAYLEKHPGADLANHTVKKPAPKRKKAEPKSKATAPAPRTHTELTGVFKPSTETLETVINQHKAEFDKIDKEAVKAAESFKTTRVTDYGEDFPEIESTDFMTETYPKLSKAEKIIHVAGHEVGQRFEKALSKPEKNIHDRYLHNWHTASGSWDQEGNDRPEDFVHTSQELQGLVSSLGVSGHPAPEDVAADKLTKGGVSKARAKASKDAKLASYAKKMYDYQQAYFRNAGLKEITLYRGVKGPDVDGAAHGSKIKVQSRELSSFTADPNVAKGFGRVIEFKVPVERVFASSLVRPLIGSEASERTSKEAEFIIMGASDLEGRTIGKPINRGKTASDKVIEVPITDENADWLEHTRRRRKKSAVLRVLRRFQASLAQTLESHMRQLLAGPLSAAGGNMVGHWLEENFSFLGAKTPRGQKQLKDRVQKLHWWLNHGIGQHNDPEHSRATIEGAWEDVKSHLPDLVKHFSEEGGKVVPKEISLNGNTYVNVSGFSEAELTKYAKRLDAVFEQLKGWRRKALSGGVRVALAGPKEFRGTAGGKYRSSEDTLYIRATPSVLKRDGSKYAGFEYIIVHELAHRYEGKNHVPEDFDKMPWWTTRYSRNEGESFAELFALSNFGLTGTWDPAILDRFETVMGGP